MENVVPLQCLAKEGSPSPKAQREENIGPRVKVDVRLVAEGARRKNRDVALMTKLTLGCGEPRRVTTDVEGRMEDLHRSHRRKVPAAVEYLCAPDVSGSGNSLGTSQTFFDKWHNNPDLAFRQTLTPGSDIQEWILRRNGFATPDALAAFLTGKSRILDAGCGNGRVTALLRGLAPDSVEIVGVDLTAWDVAAENLAGASNTSFQKADLLGDLSPLGQFDFIYCQEVLHHTGDPPKAFGNVASLLAPGGELAIYVYREKAPIREFADDLIREGMKDLGYDEALEVSRAIAELGRALSKLEARVEVPAIPILGISAGDYDVQRFVYHHFLKCFWSDELDAEGNAVINFDWYRPEDCTRHTLDEVLGWYESAGLTVTHSLEDEYGITVRGRR